MGKEKNAVGTTTKNTAQTYKLNIFKHPDSTEIDNMIAAVQCLLVYLSRFQTNWLTEVLDPKQGAVRHLLHPGWS